MINYLVARGRQETVAPFVDEWAPRLRHRVRFVFYEDLPAMQSFPPGGVIFSDLEWLRPPQLQLAAWLHSRLTELDPGRPVLNQPGRTWRRYELLMHLERLGLNSHKVYRVGEWRDVDDFPVFLRSARHHTGPLSELLSGPDELRRAVFRELIRGRSPSDLLIVEFCDTSEQGLFTKYGAFIVGDRVLARHLQTSSHWVVKGDAGIGDRLESELEYVRTNPHERQIRDIAAVAGVEFGRIDYSMLSDRVVTWEINTNPQIVRTRDQEPIEYLPKQDLVLPALESTLLDQLGGGSAEPTPLDGIPETLRAAAAHPPTTRAERARSLGIRRFPWVRRGLPLFERLASPLAGRLNDMLARPTIVSHGADVPRSRRPRPGHEPEG